jgi:hypothetical protein
MLNIRRSLTACAVVLLAFTTACSDSMTGPSAKKRSGYITASSAVTTDTTRTSGTKTGGTVKPTTETTNSSGYNVTAF